MNIAICPDSFKYSLSSEEICEVLLSEMKKIVPAIDLVSIPMADGGEGTLEVIHSTSSVDRIQMLSQDPIGRTVTTYYLWDPQSQSIIIEMAQASGIERLTGNERNCMHTSTYGTGLQIIEAIKTYNPKRVYLTVGSSATNDGGLGMLSAMGCVIRGIGGDHMKVPTGKDLMHVTSIERTASFLSLIDNVEFVVVNDVDNPFSGIHGAAHTYGKQKGASPDEILILDEGLKVIRDIVIDDMDINLDEVAGAGAAGGIAGGGYAYLGATMISGTSFVSDVTDLEDALKNADIVITGEGRLDNQTLQGKLVHHVSQLCMTHDKIMIVICGVNDMSDQELERLGNPSVYALNEYNPGEFTVETTKRDLKKVIRDIINDLKL